MLNNIISIFGFPRKIITDNATTFKSNKMVKFCSNYNIILAHSTAYYTKGNGLEESSNKSLVRIIKKLLSENKRVWNTKLKFQLWVDRISTKRAMGTSPFHLVYGTYVIFIASLGAPVMRFLQEEEA